MEGQEMERYHQLRRDWKKTMQGIIENEEFSYLYAGKITFKDRFRISIFPRPVTHNVEDSLNNPKVIYGDREILINVRGPYNNEGYFKVGERDTEKESTIAKGPIIVRLGSKLIEIFPINLSPFIEDINQIGEKYRGRNLAKEYAQPFLSDILYCCNNHIKRVIETKKTSSMS